MGVFEIWQAVERAHFGPQGGATMLHKKRGKKCLEGIGYLCPPHEPVAENSIWTAQNIKCTELP
jgi:hypothetical protein